MCIRDSLEDAGEAARLADGRFERRAVVGRRETRRAQAVRDGVALLAQDDVVTGLGVAVDHHQAADEDLFPST